ncbi:hypothetical protein DINM_001726 [Dirofilaria immitis]|nr:hypothetical protein [Dirofilaria immitis]
MFLAPSDFKPLITILPSTLTMLDANPVQVDHAEAINSNTETKINSQFSSSESDIKRYYRNKEQMLIMHRSKRSFEMVLQEVCVQHLSVETMRNIHQTELSKASKDDTADHCNNYYNNNNNNDEDFLSARKRLFMMIRSDHQL